MVLNVYDQLSSQYVGLNINYNSKKIELNKSNNLIYYQFNNWLIYI